MSGIPVALPDRDGARRAERALWITVAVAVAVVVMTALLRLQANPILAAVVAALVLVAGQRRLLAWGTLLGAILLVILFIPIRRYTIGGGLPIELEPYRILIAVVLGLWLCALCVDPAVRWRRTGFEAPVLILLGAIVASLALNIPRVNASSEIVIKQVSFFASFFLVTYFVSSIVRRGPSLDRVLQLLVGGGAVLAALTLVEWRTGTNMFNSMHRVIPILHYVDFGDHLERGETVRALGSAQHSIALGAALVMLIPPSVYLFHRDGRRVWLACGGVLALGALATGSRTAALMLMVLLACFVWIKREEALRMAPALVAMVVVVQVVMPGTLGTLRALTNPAYVIEEQSSEMGTGSGRIADLGPSLEQWAQNPLFGQGFATRITSVELGPGGVGDADAAQILDNQWLGTLLEIGAVGAIALAWLFARAVRRLARRARSDQGADSWLAAALATSLASYAIGILTYDAFSFIQVTFLAFVMLGLAAVVTREERPSRAPAPLRLRPLRRLEALRARA